MDVWSVCCTLVYLLLTNREARVEGGLLLPMILRNLHVQGVRCA